MDERAVANFVCGTQFFNVWVPLSVVNCDPLAILLPGTVRNILLPTAFSAHTSDLLTLIVTQW